MKKTKQWQTQCIVVMGVSGSGKTLIGQQIAEQLGFPFFDADDFHSPANVRKMAEGTPLSDDDRRDWLIDLAELLADQPRLVLACSALRRSYRDRLRQARPDLMLLYLAGDMETVWQRYASRRNHYFNGRTMLESQFQQLEEPDADEAVRIDIGSTPQAVIAACLDAVKRSNPT